MACEHSCGLTTGCARSGLLWNKTFIRHWCVLASLIFNILIAAVIDVAYTRFKADKDIMDALFGAPST